MSWHLLYTQCCTLNMDKTFVQPFEGGTVLITTGWRAGGISFQRSHRLCLNVSVKGGLKFHLPSWATESNREVLEALRCRGGCEHSAEGSSHCISQRERHNRPPKGSPCLRGPLTLLPLSCRPPCLNLNPSSMIKQPSINYLQYMQMSIRLAGA